MPQALWVQQQSKQVTVISVFFVWYSRETKQFCYDMISVMIEIKRRGCGNMWEKHLTYSLWGRRRSRKASWRR